MPDLWLTGDHFAAKCTLSNQAISAFITGVETIKRQIRAAFGCMVAGKNLWALAWTAQNIDCTSTLSVTQKRCCSCGIRLVALYVLYAFAYCEQSVK